MRLWNFYLRQLFKLSPSSTSQLFLQSFCYSVLFVILLHVVGQSQIENAIIPGVSVTFIVFILMSLLIRVTKTYLDAEHAHSSRQQILEQYKIRQRNYRAIRKELEKSMG